VNKEYLKSLIFNFLFLEQHAIMYSIEKISFLPAWNPGAASARVFSPAGQLSTVPKPC
jgi:hypothetical protein